MNTNQTTQKQCSALADQEHRIVDNTRNRFIFKTVFKAKKIIKKYQSGKANFPIQQKLFHKLELQMILKPCVNISTNTMADPEKSKGAGGRGRSP